MTTLRRAAGPGDYARAAALFRAYAATLGFALDFQDFDRELATLPGAYAEPGGCLLIAEESGEAVGCVALRPLDAPDVCEMKRLYIAPGSRGRGVGRLLAEGVVAEARARGYSRMRLDTVPGMDAAIALYRRLGFVEIAPYRHNPIPGALYFELRL
ncbi:MAG TPA: GNAT family N-acetyltransferase [Candidatus Eisenbacteria bacterium]|nr:GNAT family N-acetyltransferase [Candidatus Eisenbacteria bacterium]